jgi:outer membrane protein assembly factor BamB
MYRKLVLLVLVSVLLFSAVLGAGLVERRVDVASSGDSGLEALSGSGESGSVDWWPMYHHDLNHTGYSTSKAPETNRTRWKYAASAFYSSPAVFDGKVYVGSNDNNLYCLNATSGAHIWHYTTGDWIWSSPAVADGRVYVGSRDNNLYCLNATSGAHIWHYQTTGFFSSPSVAYGKVYVGGRDHNVYCLDAYSGAFIWSYTAGDFFYSSPAVANGRVYIYSYDKKLYCLNATTGAHVWNYTLPGYAIGYYSPTIAGDTVFAGSSSGVVALNASTGTLIWSYASGGVDTCPATVNDRVYVNGANMLHCLNASTGSPIWNYTVDSAYTVNSSPSVADGKVYVGSPDYKVYCLDASTGAFIWSYKTGASVSLSSPAVANGVVYVGSTDGYLYAFGSHDIAITSVTPSTAEPYSGQTVNITVVVENKGSYNENFSVNAYSDSVLVGSLMVTNSIGGTEETLTFSWNTTDVLGGYYTISANATIVPGETDTADNNFIDGTITVTSPVRIAEVIPCNQTGYPKDAFKLGTLAFFKVTINSTALIPQNTLITINLYDNASITIGVESIQGPLLPGTSTYIFGLSIPSTATIGTATVYACAYTDWPSQGGFPHCPEMSVALEITGP